MTHSVQATHRTREDRLWESAMAQLTAEGAMASGEALLVRERHDAVAMQEQAESRRTRVIELAAYAGAALMIIGVGAISTQMWDRFDESLQVVALGILALTLIVAATLIAAVTPGGVSALTEQSQGPRRRLVAVLGTAGAGLTTGTVALAIQAYLPSSVELQWMPVAFAVGLAICVVTVRFVPGVVPTLGVLGLSGATAISVLDAFGQLDGLWATPLAGVMLGSLGAFVLARVLVPAVLVEALCIAAWLGAAAGGLAAEEELAASPGEATFAIWIGRVALVILVLVGGWIFTKGADWPWAVGAAVGLAVLVQFTFAGTLGGAVAMTLAGLALVAISVVLARTRAARPTPAGEVAPAPAGVRDGHEAPPE